MYTCPLSRLYQTNVIIVSSHEPSLTIMLFLNLVYISMHVLPYCRIKHFVGLHYDRIHNAISPIYITDYPLHLADSFNACTSLCYIFYCSHMQHAAGMVNPVLCTSYAFAKLKAVQANCISGYATIFEWHDVEISLPCSISSCKCTASASWTTTLAASNVCITLREGCMEHRQAYMHWLRRAAVRLTPTRILKLNKVQKATYKLNNKLTTNYAYNI